MTTFAIKDLAPQTYFSSNVFLDKDFLLATSSNALTRTLLNTLAKWNFLQVLSDGNIVDKTQEGVTVNKAPLSPQEEKAKKDAIKNVAQNFEEVTEFDDILSDKPKSTEPPLATTQAKPTPMINSETERISKVNRINIVKGVYFEYINFINTLYTRYATHRELNLATISNTVRELCIYIKDNRSYVLRIMPSLEERGVNFLVDHCMRVTVLALSCGLQLRLPLTQLVELGVAGILHEIGMIRLSPQLYMTQRPLSVQERFKLNQHPLMGYKIVKDAGFPLSIQLGILDHHEKENAQGYPRKIDSTKISLFGKILCVACSYDAITAPRGYKESKSTYDGMIEMLNNKDKSYDQTIIMALVHCLSLYPVGSYVYLACGKVAQVIDAVPGKPKNPIVQIIGENTNNSILKTVATDDKQLKITRVLSKAEVESLQKTLHKK